jgi:hypothetical protein
VHADLLEIQPLDLVEQPALLLRCEELGAIDEPFRC